MSFRVRALVLAIVVPLAGAAAPAGAYGLLDAFVAARQFDPEYRSAWSAREAGVQEERIARSQLLPQASFSYSYNRKWLDQEVDNPATARTTHQSNSNYPSYVGRVEVRQPVLNLQAWAGLQQGKAVSQQAEAEFDGKHQELMLRLYTAFSNTLLARDQVRIAEAQRVALEEQMRANESLFASGEGTRTDVIETRSRYDMAEAQVIEAQDELGSALRTLISIIGPDQIRSVDELDQLVPKFSPSPDKVESLEQWLQLARTSNARVVAGRHSVEAAQAAVSRQRAGHYPTVDVVASHQRDEADSVSTINQYNRTNMVGVQVRVPLYSGGGVNARTTQAVAQYERARADLDAMINKVEVELRREYARLRSSATKVRALESAVESATLLVEATRKSVAGGVRVNLDVLNAEERLFTARRDLAQARYDYLESYMNLRYYAGVLTIDDLETVARYFAPPGSVQPDSAYAQLDSLPALPRAAATQGSIHLPPQLR